MGPTPSAETPASLPAGLRREPTPREKKPCKVERRKVRGNGTGMLVAAGLLGGLAVVGQLSILTYLPFKPLTHVSWRYLPVTFNILQVPAVSAAGLFYGGMYRYGRQKAYFDLFEQRTQPRSMTRMAQSGLILSWIAGITTIGSISASLLLCRPSVLQGSGMDSEETNERIKRCILPSFAVGVASAVGNGVAYAQRGFAGGYNRRGTSFMASVSPVLSSSRDLRTLQFSLAGRF